MRMYRRIPHVRVTWQAVCEEFDWVVEFAEVFINGGFDIVLANPPYVRQELIVSIKPSLRRLYPSIFDGRADIYCFFYARAIELLRQNGVLAFISSNKWFTAKYGNKLRSEIASRCTVRGITDFGELPVFEAAATFPTIFVAQRNDPEARCQYTQVQSLEAPYPDLHSLVRSQGSYLSSTAITPSGWLLVGSSGSSLVRQLNFHRLA